MSYSVEWSPASLRELARLDKPVAVRVIQAVNRFAETLHGDVKKLKGSDSEYRLRVGQWRVRFSYDHDARQVKINSVASRAEAYR